MPSITLWGSANKGRSSNVTAQRRINLYAEAPQGMDVDKGQFILYPRPGMKPVFGPEARDPNVSSPYANYGPVRAMKSASISSAHIVPAGLFGLTVFDPGKNDLVVGAAGNALFVATNLAAKPCFAKVIYRDGSFVDLMETTSGAASIAISPYTFVSNTMLQGLVVDGKSMYGVQVGLVDPGVIANACDLRYPTAFFSTTTANSVPLTATSITFIAGRYVCNDIGNPGRFYWSPVAYDWASLTALSNWNALDYATAESSPDPLLVVLEHNGELLLMGSATIEVWAPTGDVDVFSRVSGAVVQWGLAAVNSVAKYGTSLLFMGRAASGGRQVAKLDGYQVQLVSTPDIEALIDSDPQPDQAIADVFTCGGVSYYRLRLSQSTYVLNLRNGMWDEWKTGVGNFVGTFGCAFMGGTLIADAEDCTKWYMPGPEYYQDGSSAILRQVDTRHVAQDLERITVNRVALDVEQGVGLNSGQGSDPQIALQVSRDGGHTFGNELWTTLGKQGRYSTRVEWWRLGRARDFVFRFKIFDAIKAIFIGSSVDANK